MPSQARVLADHLLSTAYKVADIWVDGWMDRWIDRWMGVKFSVQSVRLQTDTVAKCSAGGTISLKQIGRGE